MISQRTKAKISLYGWWIFILSTLIILSFMRLAEAADKDPDIPLYEPPKEEPLPSPVDAGGLPPLQVTDDIKDDVKKETKAASKPIAKPKVEKKNGAVRPMTKTPVPAPERLSLELPHQPGTIYATQLQLFGGNFQLKSAKLKNIRFSQKKHSGRIVLDFASLSLPWCHVTYNQNQENRLVIECSGVRQIEIDRRWKKSAKRVRTLSTARAPYLVEENQLTLDWVLKKGSKVKAFQLQNPGRLVLDLVHGKKK